MSTRKIFALVTVAIALSATSAVAVDADNNGIDDKLEIALGEQFKPTFVFHYGNPLEPEPVEIMNHTVGEGLVEYNDVFVEAYNRGGDSYSGFYCELWTDCGDYDISNIEYATGWWPFGAEWLLYFNHLEYGVAGDEDATVWRDKYQNGGAGVTGPGSAFPARIYMHPFLLGTDIVLQYWFFYPFDDWVANHEGDWEHINVVVRLDAGKYHIADIDYYLHDKYLTVGTELDRVHVVDGTHPVVYVGGYGYMDCVGATGSGHVSGASFPAPGAWFNTGADVTIGVTICRPEAEIVSPGRMLSYRDVEVEIMPRIHRIDDNTEVDGVDDDYFAVHPEKQWMRCNVYWGTRWTDLPGEWEFGDALSDKGLGNIAPFGPRFQTSWGSRSPSGFTDYRTIQYPGPLYENGSALFVSVVAGGKEVHNQSISVAVNSAQATYMAPTRIEVDLGDNFVVTVPQDIESDGQTYYFLEWSVNGEFRDGGRAGNSRTAVVGSRTESLTAVYSSARPSWEWEGASLGLPSQMSRAAWGDYDGDGYADVAFADNSGALAVYRNQGGVFAPAAVPALGSMRHLAWVDYDNDGDLDLAAVAGEYYASNILLHNDNGVFYETALPTPFDVFGRTSWCDVDSDGDMDGVVTGTEDHNVSAMLGNESGYLAVRDGALPAACEDVAWGDYDGDGDYDIFRLSTWAYIDYSDSFLLVNDGGGEYHFIEDFPPADRRGAFAACWADFDNDSRVDLFVDGALYFNGGGNWSLAQTVAEASGNAVIADYDNDGWVDLFYGGRLYRNDHGHLVDETGHVWYSGIVGNWDFVDIDKDGKPELVSTDGGVKIYRNIDDSTNRYCRVALRGRVSGARGDGAVVTLGDVTQYYVQGSGYSGSQYTGVFGLGDMSGDVLGRVRWPSGLGQEFTVSSGTVEVCVDEDLGSFARYADRSEEDEGSGTARLPYQALPYSCATVDYDGAGPRDLIVAMLNDAACLYAAGANTADGGIPAFEPVADVFGERGAIGLLGLAISDVDGDGLEEVFAAAQVSPRLYRLTNGTYTDVADDWGVAAVGAKSTAGAWADYDCDGDLDLVVATSDCGLYEPGVYNAGPPVADVLLRNDLNTGGTFTDVSAAAGLNAANATNSTTVSWGDVNEDGYPDFFVGEFGEPILGGSGYNDCRLYLNQRDGTFIDKADSLIGSHAALFTISSTWRDMNNDGHLDLELGQKWSRESLRYDPDVGLASLVISEDDGAYSGLRVYDYDLDGLEDVILLPSEPAASPRLLAANDAGAGITYTNVASAAGIGAPGKIGGAVTADLNGDGDIDLFLGREPEVDSGGAYLESDQYLFQAKSSDGSADAPTNHWFSVRLQSSSLMNNRMGIGAVVRVYEPGRTRARMVDGGSGRGGQDAPTMVFGLGSATSVESVTIDWPNGYHQVVPGTSLNISTGPGVNGANVIEDASSFSSPMCVVAGRVEVVPQSQLIDWIFTWTTDLKTNPDLDEIVFDTTGMSWECQEGLVPLNKATPDVEIVASILADGRMQHQLTWRNRPCVPNCTLKFRAHSWINTNEGVSGLGQRAVKFCQSN